VSRGLTRSRAADFGWAIAAAGLAVAFATVLATWRITVQGSRDEQRAADAIVVLGAAQYDGRPSPVFQARLDHAVELWHKGLAKWFIVTGGNLPGDRTTEAATARAYAIDHGVPAEAIFGEDKARNTLNSLRSVAALMRDRGLTSAVFVSDPSHMLRILRLADDLDIRAYGSPTRTSPIQNDPREVAQAVIHELGALAVYFATGGELSPAVPEGSGQVR
jgi:uncharacterized SAM-binding protein YcdF (DUF218 family)